MYNLSDPNIFPLFSIPVYKTSVLEYENEVIDFDEISSENFYLNEYTTERSIISKNQNILLEPEYKNIKSFVDCAIQDYIFGLLKFPTHIIPKCVCSWMIIGYPGSITKPHIHINSVFSGVFYLKSEEDSGDLVFTIPATHMSYITNTISPIPLDHNIYNATSWTIKPKTNDLIIFPSHLNHAVTENKSDEVRAAIAFNYFLTGPISFQNSNILSL